MIHTVQVVRNLEDITEAARNLAESRENIAEDQMERKHNQNQMDIEVRRITSKLNNSERDTSMD